MILDAFQLTGRYACHGRSGAIRSWGRKSFYLSGSIADPAVCESLIETTVEQFGSIDTLVKQRWRDSSNEHVFVVDRGWLSR